jgi:hypothetical protein
MTAQSKNRLNREIFSHPTGRGVRSGAAAFAAKSGLSVPLTSFGFRCAFPLRGCIRAPAMRIVATRQFLPGALLIDFEQILRLLRAVEEAPQKSLGKSSHALR